MVFSIISLLEHKKKRKCEEHKLGHILATIAYTRKRRALLLHFRQKTYVRDAYARAKF